MAEETKEILNELKEIKIDIEFIKDHMVDADAILTKEEDLELDESLKELKEGKTVPLSVIKEDKKNA